MTAGWEDEGRRGRTILLTATTPCCEVRPYILWMEVIFQMEIWNNLRMIMKNKINHCSFVPMKIILFKSTSWPSVLNDQIFSIQAKTMQWFSRMRSAEHQLWPQNQLAKYIRSRSRKGLRSNSWKSLFSFPLVSTMSEVHVYHGKPFMAMPEFPLHVWDWHKKFLEHCW